MLRRSGGSRRLAYRSTDGRFCIYESRMDSQPHRYVAVDVRREAVIGMYLTMEEARLRIQGRAYQLDCR